MGFIAEASDSMSQAKVTLTSKIIRRTLTRDENVVPRSRKGMAMYHGVVLVATQSHNRGSLAGGCNCIRTIIIRHEGVATFYKYFNKKTVVTYLCLKGIVWEHKSSISALLMHQHKRYYNIPAEIPLHSTLKKYTQKNSHVSGLLLSLLSLLAQIRMVLFSRLPSASRKETHRLDIRGREISDVRARKQ
jgi:hypothetical protein